MTIDLDAMDRDPWSDRDRLPREPIHKKQRLRVFAPHLEAAYQEYTCTVFRVDPRGALILTAKGEIVAAFAPGMWASFESVPIADEPAAPDSSL